jgi:hypothetical protein
MDFTTTLLFYLLFGGGVAAALYLMKDGVGGGERWFRTLTAVAFWPLYLPTLLHRAEPTPEEFVAGDAMPARDIESVEPSDEIARTIRQVETELETALRSLDGWSDAVLAREQHRVEELRAAWHMQAAKIRELDRLLAQPAFSEPFPHGLVGSSGGRFVTAERARSENVARLRAVRDQLHDGLLDTLARVRELVTMIHVAKYTGAPVSRAEELVTQIATSVEGLSEVASWRDVMANAD